MLDIVRVPFHGETIITIETDDGVYVPVLPLCDRFGFSLTGQAAKFRDHPERWSVKMFFMETPAGRRETLCLPLTKIAGWLATINPAKVKPEAREAVVAYQREADAVLDRHFRMRDRGRAADLAEAEAAISRMRAMALAGHPLMNRIARLQEAGCSLNALHKVLRLPMATVDALLDVMEEMDLIDAALWTGRQPSSSFLTPVQPTPPLDEIMAAAEA